MTSKPRKGSQAVFRDQIVLYESSEDKCWVAHSLRMDQIGTGDCVLDALVDAMRAVQEILELAAKDSTIRVYRDAPLKVQRLAQNAQPLPGEIFEIAHKIVHGKWPSDIKAEFALPHRKRLVANVDSSKKELILV